MQLKQGDPNLKEMLLWKQEIQGASKATNSLWAQWNQLQLKNAVLYCKWETKDGHSTRLQLVLPRSLVPDVLSALHDVPSAGNLGVTKTVKRVRSLYDPLFK